MFKDLWKEIPLFMKLIWAVGLVLSVSLTGFGIWAIIEILNIARAAVGG